VHERAKSYLLTGARVGLDEWLADDAVCALSRYRHEERVVEELALVHEQSVGREHGHVLADVEAHGAPADGDVVQARVTDAAADHALVERVVQSLERGLADKGVRQVELVWVADEALAGAQQLLCRLEGEPHGLLRDCEFAHSVVVEVTLTTLKKRTRG